MNKKGIQAPIPWNQYLTGPSQPPPPSLHEPTPDLRAQLLPFQDYSPQQIQEQLQRLHIQQQHEPQSLQPTVVANQADYDFNVCTSNTDTGGGIISVSSSGSSSSIASSRKNSLIEQILLSPSPPAAPVPSPQTHGTSTPSAGNSVFGGHSPPSAEHLHQQVGRRHSFQDSATQHMNLRKQRCVCMHIC